MDIHCKVLYGEEFRRFVVKSVSFNELFETVKRLFNLPDGCTLKYKDDEGDLVTMSSDEELLSAKEFSSSLLHIVVANPNQSRENFSGCPKIGNFGAPHHPHPQHMHGGHHGGHGRGGRKGWKRENKWDKHEKNGKNSKIKIARGEIPKFYKNGFFG
jgi:hypothetical protein